MRSARRLLPLLCLGALACGPTIAREKVSDAPIAFIRQKASEGILGFDDFRDALRLENPENDATLRTRLKTSLALLNASTGAIHEVPDAGLGSVPLDWSSDGTRLLIGKITAGARNVELFDWNHLTGVWRPFPVQRVGLGASLGAGSIQLAWSAPVQLANGMEHALFVSTEDNPREPRLVVQDAGHPDVAPDGQGIVYASEPDASGREGMVMLVQLDGSEPRAITRGSYPRFSRDGRWIVFLRTVGANSDVWLMRADGSARRKLTDTPYAEEFPSLSPDGSYAVFASARGEETAETQLYLLRVSDGAEIQLTHGGQNGRPIW